VRNRIKEFRSARKWSQGDFAERLGVSRQTANAIEAGKTDPSLSLALRVAWLFDQPLEEIFTPDLEDKMTVLGAAWAYKTSRATAFDEIRVLEEMGIEGWELTSFGVGSLRFRRPQDASLRVPWKYKRVAGLMTDRERSSNEADGWTFCGSWMSLFHYFKRRA
jgi:DNA-binding XRE family transcriptional regulator